MLRTAEQNFKPLTDFEREFDGESAISPLVHSGLLMTFSFDVQMRTMPGWSIAFWSLGRRLHGPDVGVEMLSLDVPPSSDQVREAERKSAQIWFYRRFPS